MSRNELFKEDLYQLTKTIEVQRRIVKMKTKNNNSLILDYLLKKLRNPNINSMLDIFPHIKDNIRISYEMIVAFRASLALENNNFRVLSPWHLFSDLLWKEFKPLRPIHQSRLARYTE